MALYEYFCLFKGKNGLICKDKKYPIKKAM